MTPHSWQAKKTHALRSHRQIDGTQAWLSLTGLREGRLINIFMEIRHLCLIIFVIPAAAAVGFDVPAVDLNWGRFPSHPPSASQPSRRQRQQRIHTPLGHTHLLRLHLRILFNTKIHTQTGLFYLRGNVPMWFCVFAANTQSYTSTPSHASTPHSWSSRVLEIWNA